MTEPKERQVTVNGRTCRVWEKGQGEPLGYLAGFGGLPRWTPVLDRLAAKRRVIVPSLPGFPGADMGHDQLDVLLDWVLATRDLLGEAGLDGADLMGASVGGALAAEVAAIFGPMVKRLILVAPLGIYDEAEPVADLWAQRPGQVAGLVCQDPAKFNALVAAPEGVNDPIEWQIIQVRASEAAARLLWPLSDTKLAQRLPRIRQRTLLLWGREDKVVPPSYAKRFADRLPGATTIRLIDGAGHLADLDQPDAVADAALAFLEAR
ncbi:MAG: alpha/beta fold hydrolase [Alphaproteobacteria bacterium]|nr:alpha/beta fold hydrolase [Alphaproteobacteria bacterium]